MKEKLINRLYIQPFGFRWAHRLPGSFRIHKAGADSYTYTWTLPNTPLISNFYCSKTSNALNFYRVTSKGYLSTCMEKGLLEFFFYSQFLKPNDWLWMKLKMVHVRTPKGWWIFVIISKIVSYKPTSTSLSLILPKLLPTNRSTTYMIAHRNGSMKKLLETILV